MAKDDKKENGAAENKQAEQRQIALATQYVKDLSFESPKAPAVFQNKERPKIDVFIDVKGVKISDDLFESALTINIKAKHGDETSFIVELTYAGLFALKNIPEKELEQVLLIFCPNLLFPFARRVIADATRDGGMMPLMLDPIDFGQLYFQRKQQNEGEKKAAADATD